MAGDWIKMRTNLWDDPRVSRLCDETGQSEAAIIGALYWLWSSADEHTEDGIMPGLSIAGIDRKTGVKGIGAALCAIGWIADHPDGVRIVRFEEHNGQSAKRRCSESRRKMSARDADTERIECGTVAEESQQSGAPREDVEKRRVNQEPKTSGTLTEPAGGTVAGLVCARLRQAGIQQVNPSHPKLIALLDAGLTEDEIVAAADGAAAAGKGFAWVLAKAEGQRREAATVGVLPQARASPRATRDQDRAKVSEILTGRNRNERTVAAERDITAESHRIA